MKSIASSTVASSKSAMLQWTCWPETSEGSSYFENVRAIAAAIAIRAANENVAEELHFDFLKTCAAAFLALALRGIETESAGFKTALTGDARFGE